MSVDPLAADYPAWSTYTYVFNSPIQFVDPDGKSGVPVIDAKTKTITVNVNIIFYGEAASDELAKQVANNISTAWNQGWETEGGWKMVFNVTGSYSSSLTASDVEGNTDLANNYIKVVDTESGSSFVDGFVGRDPGGNTGVWRLKDIEGKGTTTAVHEFGHMMGLVKGTEDGHPINPDHRGTGAPEIMAARGSIVDPQYQYDPEASPGSPGGTINPKKRVVKAHNAGAVVNGMKPIIPSGGMGDISWTIGYLTKKYH